MHTVCVRFYACIFYFCCLYFVSILSYRFPSRISDVLMILILLPLFYTVIIKCYRQSNNIINIQSSKCSRLLEKS